MQKKILTLLLIFFILIPFYYLASLDLMQTSTSPSATTSYSISNITQIVDEIIGGQWKLVKNVTISNSSYAKYQYWLKESSSWREIYICIIYFSNESLAKEQFNVIYQRNATTTPLFWSGLSYENINGTVFYYAQYGDLVNYFGVYAITQNRNYIIIMNFFRFHLSYNYTKGGISLSEIAELINAIESSA